MMQRKVYIKAEVVEACNRIRLNSLKHVSLGPASMRVPLGFLFLVFVLLVKDAQTFWQARPAGPWQLWVQRSASLALLLLAPICV